MDITIFGSWAGGNKGDLAILLTQIQEVKKRIPQAYFHIPSKHPEHIQKFLEKEPIKIHKTWYSYFGFSSFSLLKKSDAILFGGGGLFFSRKLFNPGYSHVLNLFLLTFFNHLFFHKPIFIFCVGASHLHSKLAKKMTSYILNHVVFISVRDEASQKTFEALTHKTVYKYADPVFLLEGEKSERMDHLLKEILSHGIILCFQDTFFPKQEIEQLVEKIIQDYPVILYQNDSKSEKAGLFFEEQKEKYPGKLYYVGKNIWNPKEIIYLFSHMKALIASPMHACIFAFNAQVPCIPIIYDDKVAAFGILTENKYTVSKSDIQKSLDYIKEVIPPKASIQEKMRGLSSQAFDHLKEQILFFIKQK